MRNSTKKPLLLIAGLLLSLTASAYDFTVNGIYYDIDSEQDLTATVTYKSKGAWDYINDATGDITIPSTVDYNSKTYTVASIGNYAFNGCSGVSSITLPATIKSVGDWAFWGCSGLSAVNIPDGVASIGSAAFVNCAKLASISIPSSVIHVGSQAFHFNPWYDNQPDGLIYTGSVAYEYKGTCPANVEIKEGTAEIAASAFSSASQENMISVSIPNSVTAIGNGAFSYCVNLASITLPDSLTSIGDNAFRYCEKFTSVIIPNSVISIGFCAFYSCHSLTSVTIGEKVEKLGYYAFEDCGGLSTVNSLNPTPPVIDDPLSTGVLFSGISLATLNVPKGSLASYQSADIWKDFGNIKEIEAGGVESLGTAEVKITAVGNEIIVTGADDAAIVDVFNINGQLIYSGTEKTIKVPANGVYIVKTTGTTRKVVL